MRRAPWTLPIALTLSIVAISSLVLVPAKASLGTAPAASPRLVSLELEEGACCLTLDGALAAVAIGSQIRVVDLTHPDLPVVASSIQTASEVAATQIQAGRLYVSLTGGGLATYDLRAPSMPRLEASMPDLPAASDMRAEGAALLLAQHTRLSRLGIEDPSRPLLRDSLVVTPSIQHLASNGRVVVASSTDGGMLVFDQDAGGLLQLRDVVTLTGMATNVTLSGDRAFVTEYEYKEWLAEDPSQREDRPMPPVPMTSRVHRVDVGDLDAIRRVDTAEYHEGDAQGLDFVAATSERLYVAGSAYAPGANVWRLFWLDNLDDALLPKGSLFRGGAGFGEAPRNAHVVGLESSDGLLLALERYTMDDRSGSTLLVVDPPVTITARLWLPVLSASSP